MFERNGEIFSAQTDTEVVEELKRLRSELRELKTASLESRIRRDTIMGPNLAVNHSFEDGMSGWYLQGSTQPSADTAEKTHGDYSAKLATPAAIHSLCFPVSQFERYRIHARIKGSSAAGAGLYVRAWVRSSYPDGGFINESNYTGYYDLLANGAFQAAWSHHDYMFTPQTTSELWASVAFYNWTSGPTNAWVDDVYVTPVGFTYLALTLLNSWVPFGGAFFPPAITRNRYGTVSIFGAAKDGTLGTTIATLPVGCRPAAELRFPATTGSGYGEVAIDTAGNVIPLSGSPTRIQLDGITFPTA